MTPQFSKYVCFFLLVFFIPPILSAQELAPKYAKVKISLENHSLTDIVALGLWEEPDVDLRS